MSGIPALDDTFGVILISNLIGAFAFGILSVQTYFYFSRFSSDPKWLKCLVASVWLLDFAHTATTSVFSYSYTIQDFYHPEKLPLSSKIVGACLQLEPPTGLLVQLYFARRHWILNRKHYVLSGVIVAVAIVAFAFGMASGGVAYNIPEFAHYSDYTYLVMVWLAGSVVVDVLVTVSVSWTLWTSKTGFRRTDHFITKVIVWTVNTGLLTSLAAVLDIVTFVTKHTTLIHLAFNFILAKLYSNTLLASLNRRQSASEDYASHQHWSEDIKLGNVRSSAKVATLNISRSRAAPADGGVRIAMTTSNYADELDRGSNGATSGTTMYYTDLSEGERRAHGY